jgi:predicted methyltransferase MtxX (methanogen marker protein 4)
VRPYSTPGALLDALQRGEVAAAVRGTLPADEMIEALRSTPRGARIQRGALLEPAPELGVVLGPVGIAEGRGAQARARFGLAAARELALHGLLSESPLIAVLSIGRAQDAGRGARIARSLRESERVVRRLRERGLDAFHAGVQIEDVLRNSDIVIAPDGAAGNLAFRALHLAAGVPSFGGILVGSPLRFVDTSRARTSFEDPIRLAAFLGRGGVAP